MDSFIEAYKIDQGLSRYWDANPASALSTAASKTTVCKVSKIIYVCAYDRERNVLFNDALNTFYFTVIWRQTYGKGPFR